MLYNTREVVSCCHNTRRVIRHSRGSVPFLAASRNEKKVRFCALCGPTLRSSGLWRIPRSVHITLTSAMAVQAISARDTHHRHAQSRCSAHRIPPMRSTLRTFPGRHGLAHSFLEQSPHAPLEVRAGIAPGSYVQARGVQGTCAKYCASVEFYAQSSDSVHACDGCRAR